MIFYKMFFGRLRESVLESLFSKILEPCGEVDPESRRLDNIKNLFIYFTKYELGCVEMLKLFLVKRLGIIMDNMILEDNLDLSVIHPISDERLIYYLDLKIGSLRGVRVSKVLVKRDYYMDEGEFQGINSEDIGGEKFYRLEDIKLYLSENGGLEMRRVRRLGRRERMLRIHRENREREDRLRMERRMRVIDILGESGNYLDEYNRKAMDYINGRGELDVFGMVEMAEGLRREKVEWDDRKERLEEELMGRGLSGMDLTLEGFRYIYGMNMNLEAAVNSFEKNK